MNFRNFGIKLRLRIKKLVLDVRHTHIKDLRNWFLYSLKKLPDIVHLKNLVLFSGIISIVILVLFVDRFEKLSQFIRIEKPATGGSISIGETGEIDQVNPLFLSNDSEKAVVRLVFSGLTRIDQAGNPVADLAKSWKVDSTGKVYDFELRKGIKWHDGSGFSADDVVYTIETITSQETRTELYNTWQGVKVEKISDHSVRFTLAESYPDFLRVASQPLIAKHIYAKVENKNIKIAEDNNKPVGTGPYKFVRFDQLGSQPEAVLTKNVNFSLGSPYIDMVRVVSYENESKLFEGISRKQVDVTLSVDPSSYSQLGTLSGYSQLSRFTPGYEMMYFNLRNSQLASLDLRKAIVKAIDREQIKKSVNGNYAEAQWGPVIAGGMGYDSSNRQDGYSKESAIQALGALGYQKSKDGNYYKDGKPLAFSIVCPDTRADVLTAQKVSEYLAKAGIKTSIKKIQPELMTANYLKPRNFDLLVVSQNVGYSTDWFSLWGSSQVNYPGLNLSGLSDKALDKFILQARKATDTRVKGDRLKQAAKEINAQVPAMYFYHQENISLYSSKLHGVANPKITEPADYLNQIYSWYVNTKS